MLNREKKKFGGNKEVRVLTMGGRGKGDGEGVSKGKRSLEGPSAHPVWRRAWPGKKGSYLTTSLGERSHLFWFL